MLKIDRHIPLVLLVALFFLTGQMAWAGTTTTVEVVVVIESGTSSISVAQNTLNMGSLTRTPDLFRFSEGPISVSYGAVQASQIVMYTDDDQDRRGMIGTDGTTMSLRAWLSNFGPGVDGTGTPPDPMNKINWNDPDIEDNSQKRSVWSPVREVDADGEKLVLLRDAVAGDRLDVWIAVDTLDVEAQEYRASLIFEIVNQ